jgi:hypothetical protein
MQTNATVVALACVFKQALPLAASISPRRQRDALPEPRQFHNGNNCFFDAIKNGRRLARLARNHISQPLSDRPRHHRHGLEWAALLCPHGAGDGSKPKRKSAAAPEDGRRQRRPAHGRNGSQAVNGSSPARHLETASHA